MNREIKGEELRQYIHNALYTWIDERGFVHAERFTEKQLEQYRRDICMDNTDFIPRAKCSSTVMLELVTDSDYIALEHDWHMGMRYEWEDIDFFVDGVNTDYRLVENEGYRLIGFDIPKGKHDVQIWFPWCDIISLEHVYVDEGAVVEQPPKKDLRILTFGDSITQGYIGHHPAFNYVGIMARSLNAECVNQAIGGYWFEGASLDPALSEYRPDLITVAYGTNDYSLKGSLEEFRAGVSGFVNRLEEIFPEVPVLGIIPIYRCDDRLRPRIYTRSYTRDEAMDAIRAEYAKYKNITVLDDTFFPHPKDYFAPDGVHPNDLGFMVYGKAVTDAIRRMPFMKERN